MVRSTKSDKQETMKNSNQESVAAESPSDNQDVEWKQLVEEGSGAFERERYAVAEISFKSAHELAEKILEQIESKDESTEHELEAARVRLTKSLNNLAALYHVQGKYGMAEELYEKCLDLKLAMYGEEHLEVAVNLHNLAVLHSAKRKFPKAELLYKRAIEIREKLLGPDHLELVPVLKNYALLLKKTKREQEGTETEERAAAIQATSKTD